MCPVDPQRSGARDLLLRPRRDERSEGRGPLMGRQNERSRLDGIVLGRGGNEPDPRFTLANERTYLAWVRTALAFLAGGIALEAFAVDAFPGALRTVLAVLVISTGMAISLGATFRWIRVERSLRRSRPLPVPLIVPLLSLVITLATGAILLALVKA